MYRNMYINKWIWRNIWMNEEIDGMQEWTKKKEVKCINEWLNVKKYVNEWISECMKEWMNINR